MTERRPLGTRRPAGARERPRGPGPAGPIALAIVLSVACARAADPVTVPTVAPPASSPATAPVTSPEGRASAAALTRAFEMSGVGAHLAAVAPRVASESASDRTSCVAPVALDALEAPRLERTAIDILERNLRPGDARRVERFFDSAPGARVVAAERASGAIDEAAFEARLRALADSPRWTPERASRLKAMLSATGAGEFVAIVESGLAAVVALAVRCDPEDAELAALAAEAADDDADTSFYGIFMTRALIEPSGVVLEAIDDETLDALIAFARSPTGERWYRALLSATRASLSAARDALSEEHVRSRLARSAPPR